MNIRLANRPPAGAPQTGGDRPERSRPNVIVLLERPDPSPWSLRQVAGLARRLGAELLVAAVAIYDHRLDELDRVNLQIARDGVRGATSRLVGLGARAAGMVRLAAYGDQALSASDLADQLDADLVIVLARHRSRFRLFPGSPLAHQLMRRGRRPVVVIPDHEQRRGWGGLLRDLVRAQAAEE
jgi:nucleotide-binding universal stress UspA family protein